MIDIQAIVQQGTNLFIYCIFMWLVWTLITSIANQYGQPGWGMIFGVFGCGMVLLYLYIKRNYGDD